MQKNITFHPASGVNRATDGAAATERDGVNFAWWEQIFDRTTSQSSFFQSIVVPDNLDNTVLVDCQCVFRQVTAGAGNVVFTLYGRNHDPSLNDARDSAVGWTLIDAAKTVAVPGVIDEEFLINFSLDLTLFILVPGTELLIQLTRLPADPGDTFAGEVALTRIDFDFTLLDITDADWAVWGTDLVSIPLGYVSVGGSLHEKFNVDGAIYLNNIVPVGALDGTISYSNIGGSLDFWGRKAGAWVALTSVGGGADADWTVSGADLIQIPAGNVSLGAGAAPGEKIHINGAIRLNSVVPVGAVNGTISYSAVGGALDFWGRKAGAWVSLTASGASDGDWNIVGIDLVSVPIGNVGIGAAVPTEKMHINGAILLNNIVPSAATDGTISYSAIGGGLDFWGRKAGAWVSMTSVGGGGNTLGAAYNQGGFGAGRIITVVAAAPVKIDGITPSGLQLIDDMEIEFGDPAVKGIVRYDTPLTGLLIEAKIGTALRLQTEDNAPGASDLISITTGAALPGNRGTIFLNGGIISLATELGVRFTEVSGVPVAALNSGFLYVKDDVGDSELYYLDDSGNEVQMTEDGWMLAGLGTYSTTFDLNLGATVAPSSSSLTLRGGSGASILGCESTYDGTTNFCTIRNRVVGGAETNTWLSIGTSTITDLVTQRIAFGAGDGAIAYPGNLYFGYSALTSSSLFYLDRSFDITDDEYLFLGSDIDGQISFDSAADELNAYTILRNASSTPSFNIGTGEVTGGGAVHSSGDLNLFTGVGNVEASSGDVNIYAGTVVGIGVRGNLNGSAYNIGLSADLAVSIAAVAGAINLAAASSLNGTGALGAVISGGSFAGRLDLRSGPVAARTRINIGLVGDGATSATPNGLVIFNGNGAACAADIVLYDRLGVANFLWVDATNKLRVSLAHGADLAGSLVGQEYVPAAPGDWAGNPTSVNNAIDRIAAAVFALQGGVPIA